MTQQHVLPLQETDHTHDQHAKLRANVEDLENALAHLHCCANCRSESACGLDGAADVWSMVERFQEILPSHFHHEEKGLHKKVSTVSSELMELTLQFRKEHQYLANLFAVFAEAANNLKKSDDISGEIRRTKLLGGAFANQLMQHMNTEETELAGFQ
jgi:hypothetical protein